MDTFTRLWNSHPKLTGDHPPCTDDEDKPYFDNQCAISLGVALEKAGINLDEYSGVKCWQHRTHVLRAEELASWLKTQTSLVGAWVEYTPGRDALSEIEGKRGIVLFRNFWGAGNQGDHIDLWNGNTLANGANDYFERSEDVIFWHTGTIA